MKLESQVCSLELAKQLKELGVKQESAFYWHMKDQTADDAEDYGEVYKVVYCKEVVSVPYDRWAAFTVAELGEMLDVGVTSFMVFDEAPGEGKTWICMRDELDQTQVSGTEADARAKMLIYLIENGLVKP